MAVLPDWMPVTSHHVLLLLKLTVLKLCLPASMDREDYEEE